MTLMSALLRLQSSGMAACVAPPGTSLLHGSPCALFWTVGGAGRSLPLARAGCRRSVGGRLAATLAGSVEPALPR